MAINFPTPATVGETFTDPSGIVFTWNGYGWTQAGSGGGTGTPVDAYTKTESDAKYVELVGDTMSGILVAPELWANASLWGADVLLNHPTASQIRGSVNGIYRWIIHFPDGKLAFQRFDDAGAVSSEAMSIDRATGNATFGGNLTVEKSYPEVIVNNIAGGPAGDFGFKKDSLYRWLLRDEPTTDTFAIVRFDDAGASVGGNGPLSISRATGDSIFGGNIVVRKQAGQAFITIDTEDGSGNSAIAFDISNIRRFVVDSSDDFFRINRVDDTQTIFTEAMTINRATGMTTFNADVVLNSSAAPTLAINSLAGAASPQCQVLGSRGNLIRWVMNLGDASPETGSDAGADFTLTAYTDAGVGKTTSLHINRATGVAKFSSDVNIENNAVPALWLNSLSGGTYTHTQIVGSLDGIIRWVIHPGDMASNFAVVPFDDAGNSMGSALEIERATRAATFNGDLAANSNVYLAQARVMGITGHGVNIGFHGTNQWGMGMVPQVDGVMHISFYNAAVTSVGGISTTATGTAYNVASDAELKEDLKSFDAGNIIDDTQVYDFAWKSSGERSYGVVAQQAVEVYPQAVTHQTNPETAEEFWGVDYSKYVPVILQELKRLRERVRDLEGTAGVKPPTIDPKARR